MLSTVLVTNKDKGLSVLNHWQGKGVALTGAQQGGTNQTRKLWSDGQTEIKVSKRQADDPLSREGGRAGTRPKKRLTREGVGKERDPKRILQVTR